MRQRFNRRPPFLSSGEFAYALPRRLVERNAEQAVAVEFITHRRLFGDAYRCLQPEYFFSMPERSGVFVLAFAPVSWISTKARRPGDIDLLVLPYEGDELVLDQLLAIEVKVVRASFDRPGRSPNEFGFSQAEALLDLGFPHVAVAHLIVSDESPQAAWREMSACEVLDEAGNVGEPFTRIVDTLPLELIDRSYGRLLKMCTQPELGLVSTFVRYADLEVARRYANSMWHADGRQTSPSSRAKEETMLAVSKLFESDPYAWLDNPRRG